MKSLNIWILIACLLAASASVNDSVAQSKKKSKEVVQTEATPLNTTEQLTRMMNDMIAQRDFLDVQIENLLIEINDVSKSKAKKLSKQLVIAQAQYDALDRKIAALPRSITDPSSTVEDDSAQTQEFRTNMERKYNERLANADLGKDIMSDISDPEVRRAYEKYMNQGKNGTYDNAHDRYTPGSSFNQSIPANGTFFTIQLLKGKGGMADTFDEFPVVGEYRIESGYTIYYVGTYSSESQAKADCDNIRKSTRYTDAYVIAIYKGKPISLSEARRKLR